MSNLAPFRSNQPGVPTPPTGEPIAQFGTYLEAQKAVDYLSDNQFPVQSVTIVGVDLKMVERVTGRLTYARVAIAGMLSGAWFGLFVGLILSIFGASEQGFSILAAMLIGAAFGMMFGIISYAFTGGRRDFTSTSQIVASEYRVLCLAEQAGRAQQLLAQLSREGGPSGSRPGTTGPNSSGPNSANTGWGGAASGGGPAVGGPAATGWGGQPGWGSPPSAPSDPTRAVSIGGVDGEPATAEPAAATEPITGPTYSEMIDKKRREEREREQAARAQAAREQSEREQAAREQANPEQANPEQAKPEQAKPEQANPEQADRPPGQV